METPNLIEKYLLSKNGYESVDLLKYEVNGSVIKVNYKYQYSGSEENYTKNEIELLDYMTWFYYECNKK